MNPDLNCKRARADHQQIARCRKSLTASANVIGEVSKTLALAGNEVRLKILYLLQKEQELCPCDLADILSMSVPAISQHLRKMKDAALIDFRREGQTLYYSLLPQPTSVVTDILECLHPAGATV
ncbi:metalloregulator ArsR/SmtB family transcription factor [Lewinella sp. JB7]|uniref:ArsR/SmtB family transcription factor n=1 Tax=Lewinella sp. JB7 TaxID=2962887 RepID=UPI0020C95811|nr:metalloregulator ArsR/SmtB family transcription factor [Lewinella sp. JB7]MCP9236717.1 metalloregulator ArsR/SmtB family transcription factor [Lewinella sp. JB7]